jgi:hypothetical protein
MDELQLRDARLGWRGVAILGALGAAAYAATALYGELAIGVMAGLTVGYLFARCTKY